MKAEGGERSVEVWVAKPAPAGEVEGLLDEAERARLRRFRFECDRNSYASAHALTRQLLSSLARDVAPEAWRFEAAEFGKPHVVARESESTPRFNLSHTRGLVAAAASAERVEVGVDVEAIGTLRLAQELRQRVLSP
ncbi:MAG: hypothetical protein AAGG01_20720, partial [Planctomycetota bacterium]